jgi:iron complex outermembrane receptor protein
VPLALCPGAAFAEATDDSDPHAHEHEHEEHEPTETIVVTASPLIHDRDELAIPVDRIDRSELLENLGSTLGDSIDHVPGIASSGFAAGASRPVIRGQDAYRSEVLEDGLGTHDVSRESPDHAVPVNPLAAERVEVVRGPATLRYGGGASAGVVNVITNRIPDRVPAEEIRGEVYGGIGLVANQRDFAATLEGGHGPLAWHVDGLFRRANDYSIPNDGSPSVQSGTSIDAFSGAIGGAYVHELGRLGFSYNHVDNDYGIPEIGEDVEVDMKTDRYRFEADLESPLEYVRSVRVRGVYSDYEHKEKADGVVGQTYRNEEFEGRVEVLHEPILDFTGALGFHARTRDFEGGGEAADFLAPTDTDSGAVYFYEERDLFGLVTAEMGARVEYTNVRGRDINGIRHDRDFVPVSGALSLVSMPLDWLTIGVRGAVSQRAPSQVELLARGAHEATQTFEIGDPDLDEETSYTGDFRIEAKGARGRIEWSGFVTRYEDYIYAALSGLTVDEDGNPVAPTTPDALQQLFYEGRNAVFYGTEVAGEVDVVELDCGTIGLDGRFDFVRARFASGSDRNVPRIVPIRWGGGLFFENENLDLRVGFLRTESQQKTAGFETSTSSFVFLNASLAYRIDFVEAMPLEFTVVGRNLNDVRGRNHIAFNKDDVLLPGRNIRFGLRASF